MQNNFNTNSHIFFLRAINFIEKILKRKIQFLLFLKKIFFLLRICLVAQNIFSGQLDGFTLIGIIVLLLALLL